MTELLKEYKNECGCIIRDWYKDVDKPFCSNEYWTTIEKCLICQKKEDDKKQKEQEELNIRKEEWEKHKQEINEIIHINYIPIKELSNKGFYYKNKLGHQRKEIEDLLSIAKIRNRYYVSKEKLEKFDPTKYVN
jgi:hypothetical protein